MSSDTNVGTGTDIQRDDPPLLSMEDIEVHFTENESFLNPFADPTLVRAVDGVSLDIEENDVVALVGESGCGKTTLGKVAVALQRPTSGSLKYRGQDIWEAWEGGDDVDVPFQQIRTSLQIIHQDPGSALNPNKRVRSSLARPLKKWQPHLAAEDREERIHTLLEIVEMTPPQDYAERYPHQLSGGEKQRVALVRALLMNPDLILADEAISALDVSLRVETMDLLLDLQDEFNTSFVFISHNLSNARYLTKKAGGRIAVMYLGEIVEIGPPEQIVENPQHPYTKALKWATPDLRLADEGEMPLRDIDIPDPIDPPSGCRFHTRCPEAREICPSEKPDLFDVEGVKRHAASCFRVFDDHEYWESPPLTDEQIAESREETGDD